MSPYSIYRCKDIDSVVHWLIEKLKQDGEDVSKLHINMGENVARFCDANEIEIAVGHPTKPSLGNGLIVIIKQSLPPDHLELEIDTPARGLWYWRDMRRFKFYSQWIKRDEKVIDRAS